MKKIAIIRGGNLNKWEMQNYEPLLEHFNITAFASVNHKYDIKGIKIPVVTLPSKTQGLLTYIEGLEDHLADQDLIFTADISYMFSLQAILAKIKYGCKVICLEWENIPFNYDNNEVVFKIKKTVRENADHFIAVTQRAKEALMLEGAPEELINVMPMGIDLKRFQPQRAKSRELLNDLGISSDESIVLYIGRMVWEKGIYDFIHAAAKILSDGTLRQHSIKFVMVGNGPELQSLRKRLVDLKISDRVIVLEDCPYERIHELHKIADIFVLPSIPTATWQEQFGMVIIESMASGKPVISTLSGSIPEVIGNEGILIQPNDHLSLYEAVKRLILDKELREGLGRRARSRAEKEFDSDKTADMIKELFDTMLSNGKGRAYPREFCKTDLKHLRQENNIKGFQLICNAFEKDPENREILDSVISIGLEIRNLETVEMMIRKYLKYHPADIDVLVTLSDILYRMGKDDKAEEELKRVMIFDPCNTRAAMLVKERENVS